MRGAHRFVGALAVAKFGKRLRCERGSGGVPLDALVVANELNSNGERQLAATYQSAVDGGARYVDVNGDHALTASDFVTLATAIPATELNTSAPRN